MINLLTNALSWLWLLYLLYWNPLFELLKLQSSLIDSKAFSVPIIAVLWRGQLFPFLPFLCNGPSIYYVSILTGCGCRSWEVFTFFQIGSGHIVGLMGGSKNVQKCADVIYGRSILSPPQLYQPLQALIKFYLAGLSFRNSLFC